MFDLTSERLYLIWQNVRSQYVVLDFHHLWSTGNWCMSNYVLSNLYLLYNLDLETAEQTQKCTFTMTDSRDCTHVHSCA